MRLNRKNGEATTRLHRFENCPKKLGAFFVRACLHACVSTRELLDAARGIDELLFAREERMAGRADADLDVALRRAGVIDRAARAANVGLMVVGMNICFHGFGKGIEK